jgi:hypothetical protein
MSDATGGEIRFQDETGGTRAELVVEGAAVSRLWIVPFTLRVGAAAVRMEGIAGVGTETEHRYRGHARRLLEATVAKMRAGDAALSMLYGIPDFYPKFGYATAGPDHFIHLTDLSRGAPLLGWSVRPFSAGELEAARSLYEGNLARPETSGAAIRAPEARAWTRLTATAEGNGPDSCRVVVNPEGRVAAYAWRARGCWYTDNCERNDPEALVLGEVVAESPAAGEAALAACRRWGAEEGEGRQPPLKRVTLALPPEGPVAAAARRQGARFEQRYQGCGGSMARVLDVGRLLEALGPAFAARLAAARTTFQGTLRMETEIGGATLAIRPGSVTVQATGGEETGPGPALAVRLPQAELARLALGAFPPEEVLSRLEVPVHGPAWELLHALFPARRPHMYLPDRF